MKDFLLIVIFYLKDLWQAKWIKALLSGLGMLATFLMGSFDIVLQYALTIVILDTVIWTAFALWQSLMSWIYKEEREYKFCHKKFKGSFAKFFVFAGLMITGHIIDWVLFHAEVGYGWQNFFILFICFHESISIIKHLNRIKPGLIPESIIQKFEDARDRMLTSKVPK